MPEEKEKKKVKYEILSDEPDFIIGPEGERIEGRRIAFTTEEIPYDAFFLTKEEYSPEKIKEVIAERIKKFVPPKRVVGEVEI